MKRRIILYKSLSPGKGHYLMSLLLLIVLLTGTLISYTLAADISAMIAKEHAHNINSRTVQITDMGDGVWSDGELESIYNTGHVLEDFPQTEAYGYASCTLDAISFPVNLRGMYDKMLPASKTAHRQPDFTGTDVVLPSHIQLPDGQKINCRDYVGNTILIRPLPSVGDSANLVFSLSVVGVYDETADIFFENELLVPPQIVDALNRSYDSAESYNSTHFFLMDSVDSARELAAEYHQLRTADSYYTAETSVVLDYGLLYLVRYSAAGCCILTFILIAVLLCLFSTHLLEKQQDTIALLDVLGYSRLSVCFLLQMQNLLCILPAGILASIAFLLLYPGIDQVLFPQLYLPYLTIWQPGIVLAAVLFSQISTAITILRSLSADSALSLFRG